MRLQRVLFIAPADSGLDVAPEQEALYEEGFQVQLVAQPVTRQRLFDTVRHRPKFDILHFACDADAEGVTLSAGERFDIPGMIQFTRLCGATLVFLNGCETAEIGQLMYDEGVPATICTLRKVPDVQAKETAQCFYRELATLDDIRKAYDRSKPPVKGGYSLFANGKLQELQFAPVLEKLEELSVTIRGNAQEHDEFRAALLDLRTRVEAIDAEQLKGWMLRVVGGTFAISLVLQLLFTVINRLP